jgi:cytosine/adenosine deaminase-related metal-dependent hydrolase
MVIHHPRKQKKFITDHVIAQHRVLNDPAQVRRLNETRVGSSTSPANEMRLGDPNIPIIR